VSQGVTALYFSCLLSASSVNSSLLLPGAVGNLSAPGPDTMAFTFRDAPPPSLLSCSLKCLYLKEKQSCSNSKAKHAAWERERGANKKNNQVLLKNNQPDSHAAQQLF